MSVSSTKRLSVCCHCSSSCCSTGHSVAKPYASSRDVLPCLVLKLMCDHNCLRQCSSPCWLLMYALFYLQKVAEQSSAIGQQFTTQVATFTMASGSGGSCLQLGQRALRPTRTVQTRPRDRFPHRAPIRHVHLIARPAFGQEPGAPALLLLPTPKAWMDAMA
jgi:hypothetical protein